MRRSLLLRSLGVGVLGAAAAVGCNQAPRHAQPIAAVPTSHPAVVVKAVPSSVAHSPYAQASAKLPSTPEPAVPDADQMERITLTTLGLKKEQRRVYTDITANPGFAHAADYSWLVGIVEQGHEAGSWQLRYASVDEEDRLGGTVLLTGVSDQDRWTEGALIRVEGQTLQSVSTEGPITYQVRHWRAISER